MLADEGVYSASEFSFNRVLRAHGQFRHRGRAKTPQRPLRIYQIGDHTRDLHKQSRSDGDTGQTVG